MQYKKIEWAKAYPFPRPNGCFVYADGKAYELTSYSLDNFAEAIVEVDGDSVPLARVVSIGSAADLDSMEARHPVIACGSNAAPERLRQKFGDKDTVIPTLEVIVEGYCILYAARFTRYGSVPATVAKVPGTLTTMHVNLLTDDQLEVMDETETIGVSYNRFEIDGNAICLKNGDAVPRAHAYFNRNGALFVNDMVLAPSGIDGDAPRHQAMGQSDVQGVIKLLLDAEGSVDDFIFQNIEDHSLRFRRNAFLRENHSIPLNDSLGRNGDERYDTRLRSKNSNRT